MIQKKEEDIAFRIKQFEKFYYFLMKNTPENYCPWFFPCEKNGKNPSPEAILKRNPNSKGSWHDESARLNKEEVIELIKCGYNIGISARKEDPLIIGDIDNPNYLDQMPIDTLTTTSRKRVGGHFFGWDKDGSAKINLPTNDGEIRSINQYVLSPGSYVPFNLESKKDKEAYESLPEKAKGDSLIGYYTVNNATELKYISVENLPKIFRDDLRKEDEDNAKVKENDEMKEYTGKYSDLFKLKVSDILKTIPEKQRFGHPLHESDTDANFSLSNDGTLGHCWRHMVSLNAVQYLCVMAGYKQCQECGTPHKGRGFSKIKGDKQALEIAYKKALELGLIKEKVSAGSVFSPKGQAKTFNDLQPLFYDTSGNWWLWDSELIKWKIVDEVEILNIIERDTGEDVINPKNRTIILNSLKQEGRKHIPKPIKKTWIQFKDKIIDIENGNEFSVTPEYFVTNPIPYALNKDRFIETPTMDKIFSEWVGEKYVKTLYEIIAYCLLPDYPINRLFCFIGEGMNGKSCFLRLLKKFIGEDNVTATELDTLLRSRFEVTRLHKKLVCLMGETNFAEMNQTSIIKKLTGQDTIGFEYKNKTPFDDINYAKILIATNNLPTTTDKTTGFYRRWLIIDFPNIFSEKKDILADIPEEEYTSLAIKCSFILKDLLDRREFTNEGSVEERAKKYEDHSDPLEKFIKEYTEEDLNGTIWKFEFEKQLNQWCKENRFRTMTEVVIGRKMKEKRIEQVQKQSDWLIDGQKKLLRAWAGIKWKEAKL